MFFYLKLMSYLKKIGSERRSRKPQTPPPEGEGRSRLRRSPPIFFTSRLLTGKTSMYWPLRIQFNLK